jgi:hypothetical protein
MELQDKSIIQPVLRAVEALQSSRAQLASMYRVIDQFCALWIGRPRDKMSFREDTALYLIHDLLGEYLQLEENNRRVAFWLLTLNRCCHNFTVDLEDPRRELERAILEMDLGLDTTLLEPIFRQVEQFEETHSRAQREQLGENDILGNFLQWVGIYCSYIYPNIVRDENRVNRTAIGAISFLLSEYIKLRSNVSRMAALLLGIKEACAYGSSTRTAAEPGVTAASGAVPAGQEEEYVEDLLKLLRQEESRDPAAG